MLHPKLVGKNFSLLMQVHQLFTFYSTSFQFENTSLGHYGDYVREFNPFAMESGKFWICSLARHLHDKHLTFLTENEDAHSFLFSLIKFLKGADWEYLTNRNLLILSPFQISVPCDCEEKQKAIYSFVGILSNTEFKNILTDARSTFPDAYLTKLKLKRKTFLQKIHRVTDQLISTLSKNHSIVLAQQKRDSSNNSSLSSPPSTENRSEGDSEEERMLEQHTTFLNQSSDDESDSSDHEEQIASSQSSLVSSQVSDILLCQYNFIIHNTYYFE